MSTDHIVMACMPNHCDGLTALDNAALNDSSEWTSVLLQGTSMPLQHQNARWTMSPPVLCNPSASCSAHWKGMPP